jgi:hypothetical protein
MVRVSIVRASKGKGGGRNCDRPLVVVETSYREEAAARSRASIGAKCEMLFVVNE